MILCHCVGITEEEYKEIYTDWFFNRELTGDSSYYLEMAGNTCEACQEPIEKIQKNVRLMYG